MPSCASYDTWGSVAPFEFLEAVAAHGKIEIAAWGDRAGARDPTHQRAGKAPALYWTTHGRTFISKFSIATAMRHEAGVIGERPGFLIED